MKILGYMMEARLWSILGKICSYACLTASDDIYTCVLCKEKQNFTGYGKEKKDNLKQIKEVKHHNAITRNTEGMNFSKTNSISFILYVSGDFKI